MAHLSSVSIACASEHELSLLNLAVLVCDNGVWMADAAAATLATCESKTSSWSDIHSTEATRF